MLFSTLESFSGSLMEEYEMKGVKNKRAELIKISKTKFIYPTQKVPKKVPKKYLTNT